MDSGKEVKIDSKQAQRKSKVTSGDNKSSKVHKKEAKGVHGNSISKNANGEVKEKSNKEKSKSAKKRALKKLERQKGKETENRD